MKLKLYYHGGSGNHGCEALVRTTVGLLQMPAELYSENPEQDLRYGIDEIVEIFDDRMHALPHRSLQYLVAALYAKLGRGEKLFTKFGHAGFFQRIQNGDICLSIGGDTYCYGSGGREVLADYNKIIHEKGGKTVLWGCSIDEDVPDEATKLDFARYDLITVRDSRSYELLRALNSNTVKVCDSAFYLEKSELPWPDGFLGKNVVGINMSPLSRDCADGDIVIENYFRLVDYILNDTDMQIALIPHVVTGGRDDLDSLKELYYPYREDPRVVLIQDRNCMELKGYIARCRFFVGARTHATIAAYSSMVPTLVTGYSLKARGIAEDIFGTDEHYVLPVQRLRSSDELTEAFIWMLDHENEIKKHLKKTIPVYKLQVNEGIAALKKLIGE